MTDFITKTNKPKTFDSGAMRDDPTNKPRPDLISPFMMLRLGGLLTRGATHYGARNWENGIPMSHCLASAFRHLVQFMAGERDEDHLIAVVFNLMCIVHFEETGRTDLNDLPIYKKEGK